MFARDMTAGIAVMDIPDVTFDLLLQDHDVACTHRRHARGRRGTRKASPIAGEIKVGDDMPEFVERGLASAERVRASGGTAADDPFVARRHGHGLVIILVEIS